jgi:hypothetical protein
MKALKRKEIMQLKGGVLSNCGDPPPEPPPSSSVWLPPNPDNPTANAPMVSSPN